MLLRRLSLALAFALAATACSGSTATSTTSSTSLPAPTTTLVAADLPTAGIVFTSDRAGTNDLWIYQSGLAQATAGRGVDFDPAWSPDGATIVFSSDRVNPTADLFLLDLATNTLRQLTDTPDALDHAAAYSPGGDVLVFQRTDFSTDPITADIYTLDPTTGEETRLTDPGAFDGSPAFSPDGTLIAFDSNRSGTVEIWVMNADGSNPRQVSQSPPGTENTAPVFSADGTRIIYRTVRATPNLGDIASIAVEGGPTRLLTTGPGDDDAPSLSPDGSQIVFVRDGDLWVMDSDRENAAPLTSGPANDSAPDWR